MSDLISRQAAIKAIKDSYFTLAEDAEECLKAIQKLPSVSPTLYGYRLEHLAYVAKLLQTKRITEDSLSDVLECSDVIINMELDEIRKRAFESIKTLIPDQSTMGQVKPKEVVNDEPTHRNPEDASREDFGG